MKTDGGVLRYGVAEGNRRRPTIPNPIPLAGAAGRIDQIVSTSLPEVPYVDIGSIRPRPSRSVGYIVVIVPQSPARRTKSRLVETSSGAASIPGRFV